MGGAHSLIGDAIDGAHLSSSWVIDCAGDMHVSYRVQAGKFLACVFPDLDGPLASSSYVERTVETTLAVIANRNGDAPERIYVMCQHGMNRSGLVSGLILRGLGVEGREAVDRIRMARPGALANEYFRQLVLRGQGGTGGVLAI
jgi:hypothetical protein